MRFSFTLNQLDSAAKSYALYLELYDLARTLGDIPVGVHYSVVDAQAMLSRVREWETIGALESQLSNVGEAIFHTSSVYTVVMECWADVEAVFAIVRNEWEMKRKLHSLHLGQIKVGEFKDALTVYKNSLDAFNFCVY